jgi:hypothetical protein
MSMPRPWSSALRHLSTVGEYEHRGPADAGSGTPGLEDRLDRLALICMAMWTLLQSETSLTEEDLLARVREIDLMDGSDDGRITRKVARCSRCDRPMSSRHTRCIYCGSEQLTASVFDTV